MQNSKPKLVISAILALLLYLVPNLVQDVHRVWGHHEQHFILSSDAGMQLHKQYDKCAVCVFEFNVVDQIENTVYIPSLKAETFLFTQKHENQVHNTPFDYYNLRAPPKA